MDPNPTKRRFPVRLASYTVLAALLMTLAVCALSSILIRSVDSFLLAAGQTEFADIFAQLGDADLDAHWLIPFVFWLAFVLSMGLLSRKIGAWAILPGILLGLIVLFLSAGAALWFTDVNGIRFGTVVLSLGRLLEAGIF